MGGFFGGAVAGEPDAEGLHKVGTFSRVFVEERAPTARSGFTEFAQRPVLFETIKKFQLRVDEDAFIES